MFGVDSSDLFTRTVNKVKVPPSDVRHLIYCEYGRRSFFTFIVKMYLFIQWLLM